MTEYDRSGSYYWKELFDRIYDAIEAGEDPIFLPEYVELNSLSHDDMLKDMTKKIYFMLCDIHKKAFSNVQE